MDCFGKLHYEIELCFRMLVFVLLLHVVHYGKLLKDLELFLEQ